MRFLSVILAATLFVLVSNTSAFAWYSKTHRTIAGNLYSKTPSSIRNHLILSRMKYGAELPDRIDKGRNKNKHAYPKSVPEATKWLNKAGRYYRSHDYRNASKAFGMASHYISDSYAGPHCISHVDNHHLFYEQGNTLTPEKSTMQFTSIEAMLAWGSARGRKSIDEWAQTHSIGIVKGDLDRAMSGTYAIYKHYSRF